MKGYSEKIKQQDYLQFLWWGSYGTTAVTVAVEHCLAGRKAKSKFTEKPILADSLDNLGLTEDELYEKEVQKALLAEEQWIMTGRQKGLPETII